MRVTGSSIAKVSEVSAKKTLVKSPLNIFSEITYLLLRVQARSEVCSIFYIIYVVIII